ncbi:FAD binding domain-containing protein [Nemania sp. FL0916]|nr:FAD binding domain-containing protein [Nemania sp. FL0916]
MEKKTSSVNPLRDVIIIGAGPSGLGVATRLCERMPAANFTDDEHRRFHWIKKHRAAKASVKHKHDCTESRRNPDSIPAVSKEVDILALDAYGTNWMERWQNLFKTFDISHLRSPMFFHIDPAERDGLLSYAYAENRDDELRELQGCVGKELSKHQRKKREKLGRQPKNIPTIDERDRKDYFVPSTPLFFSHCDCLAGRYKLRDDTLCQEQVEDICYDRFVEYSDEQNIFCVKTNKGCHYGKIVVLAIGGNPPHIPCSLTAEEMEGATHVMHIKTFPPLYVQKKMAIRAVTNVLVVGGGLTSAQISDLAIRRGVTKVWLIMRGPLKVKYFDIPLEWVGKFRNVEQAAFWNSETTEERYEKISQARNGGSITPYYKKIVEKQIATGRLDMLLHTTIETKQWDPLSKTWAVTLKGERKDLPPIDHIYFATGVGTDFECLPCLQSMCRDYPIENCGGFPCITENMMWRDDVPLFVAGRFAALQLGPGAHNLIGARIGADRISWSILELLGSEETSGHEEWSQDKFNYLTGRGSRYDALANIPDA